VALAVLPLDNFSADAAQDYFADGMTEALIADLAQIDGLRVISRTSTMQYKGQRRRCRWSPRSSAWISSSKDPSRELAIAFA
jgi:TolB-like protein